MCALKAKNITEIKAVLRTLDANQIIRHRNTNRLLDVFRWIKKLNLSVQPKRPQLDGFEHATKKVGEALQRTTKTGDKLIAYSDGSTEVK